MAIKTEEALGKALKRREFPLVISGRDLVDNVNNIRKPEKIAWVGAAAALVGMLGVVNPIMISAGLLSWPVFLCTGGILGGAALAVLGAQATIAALKIAFAGGGVDVLNTLRARPVLQGKDETTMTIQ